MTITLTTFVPGTKAKAEEVNANFSALKDEIELKALKGGDSAQVFSVAEATEDSHAVSKAQMDLLEENLTDAIDVVRNDAVFCVKSGNLTSGVEDLFSYELLEITPKVGSTHPNLVVSDVNKNVYTFSSLSTISMSGKSDGTYNIFIKSDGTLYVLSNTIYRERVKPTLLEGDIWLNPCLNPVECIQNTADGEVNFEDIPLGEVVISSGAITSCKTFPFNFNGIGKKLVNQYKNGTSWYNDYLQYNPSTHKIAHWIEQSTYVWGTEVGVTLLKPYATADYTVIGVTWGWNIYAYGYPISSSTFLAGIRGHDGSVQSSSSTWYICGYGE